MSERKLKLELIDGLPMAPGCSVNRFQQATSYKGTSSDVFIASYHKSGTTWLQYIVWSLANQGVDPPYVHEMMLDYGPRMEHLGTDWLHRKSAADGVKRHFKTHLPFNYITYSQDAKYIYAIRSPFDVVVSYYRMLQQMPQFYRFKDGLDFDQFVDDFLEGYTDCGSYFDHVTSWLEAAKTRSNIKAVEYEQLRKDSEAGIQEIAQFLGPPHSDSANDAEIMSKVKHNTSFQVMSKLPCVLPASLNVAKTKLNIGKDMSLADSPDYRRIDFFKTGTSGYGAIHLSPPQVKRMNETIASKFVNFPHLIEKWTQKTSE